MLRARQIVVRTLSPVVVLEVRRVRRQSERHDQPPLVPIVHIASPAIRSPCREYI